jgi:hypothetical protein
MSSKSMDFIYALRGSSRNHPISIENRAVISSITAGDYALTPADSWGPCWL